MVEKITFIITIYNVWVMCDNILLGSCKYTNTTEKYYRPNYWITEQKKLDFYLLPIKIMLEKLYMFHFVYFILKD